ncbi:MAG: asparagine synthase (glutamine-hydrolyzing) [Bacillota bacterium]|nr:asparagine synthase (glutamine-hydrolyzing) [Bacillota bacterium]
MCGIAGWVNLKDDINQYEEILDRMTAKLSQRGPDDLGKWISNHALIGHRRLVVVDPAGGSQPMVRTREGHQFIITYNGELYNTLDLRKELELRGHKFYSNSDTEVLLVSYIEWGPDCVEHLNGIYAFGVWDEESQSLFLARDRFGVKPLFYAQRGNSLIFGSELKVLLANDLIKPEIDKDGLSEIFALGPARTPGHGVFKGVYEVKPAHSIFHNSNGTIVRKYWALESFEHQDSIEDTLSKVRELVYDAITRQLVADVPVCTFLSGGLDSSAISAIAAKAFMASQNRQLHTYSIDYVGNDKFFKANDFQPDSDPYWVKRMSEEFNTQHHYITVDNDKLAEALKDAVLARDLPGMADIDSSLWLFCKEIKKEATVALSGECADEIFGGYPWFHKEELLNAQTFPWSRYVNERCNILSSEVNSVLNLSEYASMRYNNTILEVPRLPGEAPLDAKRREMFYLNIYWFMATLLERKDRMSMASGLEVRVPYCDHRLVQYVWNIPWDIKMYGNREKGLLRQALKGLLPDDVLFRKKSPYPKTHNPAYESFVRKWLLEILNDTSSPIRQLINLEGVRAIAEGTSDYGRPWFGQLMAAPQLMAYLIQVDLWLRNYKVSIV